LRQQAVGREPMPADTHAAVSGDRAAPGSIMQRANPKLLHIYCANLPFTGLFCPFDYCVSILAQILIC
jgi:hypothetical protein